MRVSSCLGLLLLLLLCLPAGFAGLPSDAFPLNPSKATAQNAADTAVSFYNLESKSKFYFRWLRVLSAHGRRMAGTLLYLTVELVNTLCEKKEGSYLAPFDLKNCPLPSEAEQQKQICEFQVFTRQEPFDVRLAHKSCKAASS